MPLGIAPSGSGALGGAATGAMVGSMLPGLGTPAGAVLGGLAGGLGIFGPQKFDFSEQEKYLAMLRKQAEEGDPFAREQLRQQTARLMSMQQGMAAGAPPSQQATAARTASQTAGRQQAGMAGQGALADVQARLGAMQQLGGALENQRRAEMQQAMLPQWQDYFMKAFQSKAMIDALKGQQNPLAAALAGGESQGYYTPPTGPL